MRRRVVTVLAGFMLLSGACGGASDLAGTYSCPDGATLVLHDDGTFTMSRGAENLTGTYEIDGETVSFTVRGFNTADGLIRDGTILLQGTEEPCVKE